MAFLSGDIDVLPSYYLPQYSTYALVPALVALAIYSVKLVMATTLAVK